CLHVDAACATPAVRALLGHCNLRLAWRQRTTRPTDRPRLVLVLSRAGARPQPQRLGWRGRRCDRWRDRPAAELRVLRTSLRALCRWVGDLSRNRSLGRLARLFRRLLVGFFLGLAARFLFGGPAAFLFAPACLLSGRQDRDLFLFAALGFPTRRFSLLLG